MVGDGSPGRDQPEIEDIEDTLDGVEGAIR
jgi:hypothetical protein